MAFAEQGDGEALHAIFEVADGILFGSFVRRRICLALEILGGIASGADAYARIRAGASAVQLYSALVYHGPGLVTRIKAELAALLRRDGFASVSAAVGSAV